MLFESEKSKLGIDGDVITVTLRSLQMTFNYSSIDTLYINNEMDETAREMQISLKKLQRANHNLADYLRMKFKVDGITFDIVVHRSEGEPLALRVENEVRQRILEMDAAPDSFVEGAKKVILADDPTQAAYPVYYQNLELKSDELEDE